MSETLTQQYKRRFASVEKYRNELWKQLIASFFQDLVPSTAHILDLGSGWGEFINNISGAQRYGMDLNPDSKNHLDPSIKFFNQDCSEPWPLADSSLDVVFTSNFLEHLRSKTHIEQTIIEIGRCLKPSGTLICLGPNIKYLPGSYWDFWDHHVELTEQSLAEVLKLHEFAIEKCVPKFLPYTMATGPNPPLFLARIYLALPFLWKIFGKQFLIIARNYRERD